MVVPTQTSHIYLLHLLHSGTLTRPHHLQGCHRTGARWAGNNSVFHEDNLPHCIYYIVVNTGLFTLPLPTAAMLFCVRDPLIPKVTDVLIR